MNKTEFEDLGRVVIALMNRLGIDEVILSPEEFNKIEKSLMIATHKITNETRVKVMSVNEGLEFKDTHGIRTPGEEENELEQLIKTAETLIKLEELKRKLETLNDEPKSATKTNKPN